MNDRLLADPNEKRIVQFCTFLGSVPLVGAKKADRLQSILFNQENRVLYHRISAVLRSFIPYSAKVTSFSNLLDTLKKYHYSAPDHAYQATLRRWVDEKQKV